MAIKKSRLKKTTANPYKLVAVISLVINAVMIVALLVGAIGEKAGTFNYALVNDGIARMCSSDYRKTVENTSKKQGDSADAAKLRLALVDYPCSKNGAAPYYQKGFNDYAASLGIKQQ